MFLRGLKTNILLYIIQNSFLTKYPYVLLIYFSIHITRSISHNHLHILPHTSYKLHIPQSTYTHSSYILQIHFPTKYLDVLPIHITNTVSHKTFIFLTISILSKIYQTLFQEQITNALQMEGI